MPRARSQFLTRRATLLRPNPGDCCVFCSFGSVKCPPMQAHQRCERDGLVLRLPPVQRGGLSGAIRIVAWRSSASLLGRETLQNQGFTVIRQRQGKPQRIARLTDIAGPASSRR